MKTKFHDIFIILAFLAGMQHAAAQGTIFTYQGQLMDNGQPANGTNKYGMVFYLYNTPDTSGTLLGNLGIVNVPVSNGLFTVTLDFGDQYHGGPAWLGISVQKNNSSFILLNPFQQLTPTPYAIFANSSSNLTGSLPASQLTGALPSTQLSGTLAFSQLPSTVVTNGEVGLTLSGTFSGNAGGLTNLQVGGAQGTMVWQVASGTTLEAQSNTGYLITNSQQVTVMLPDSPNVGDMVQVFGSGAGGWIIAQNAGQSILYNFAPAWMLNAVPSSVYGACVASSSDGSKLAAGTLGNMEGSIYTSTNFGTNWSLQPGAPNAVWNSIASSSDGSKLAAVVSYGGGGIYTSTNFGTNWSLQLGAPGVPWPSIASSSDGSKLAAVMGQFNGGIYTSTNFGTNWSLQPGTHGIVWKSIASSSDGSKLAAVASVGGIYTSTNFGTNWSLQLGAPSTNWVCIASSSDGSKLAAVVSESGEGLVGGIYTSVDFGTNWSLTSAPSTYWQSIASSSDGSKLAAAVGGGGTSEEGGIYVSANFGANWSLTGAPTGPAWQSIASSSDGSKLAAGEPAGIWTYNNAAIATTSGISGLLVGAAGSGVKLIYAGGGQFVAVSEQGHIYGQ
jgi:hypothetical protein